MAGDLARCKRKIGCRHALADAEFVVELLRVPAIKEAGESFTFEVRSKQTLTKEQLTSPKVLRCVNGFGNV
jgi:hypothetical protein